MVGLGSDRVLLSVVSVMALLSFTLVVGLPEELRDAPEVVRSAFAEQLAAASMISAAVLSAVYGSFRFTVDLRDGVVARQVMVARRGAVIAGRLLPSLLGGVAIAVVAVVCSRIVLMVAVGAGDIAGTSALPTVVIGACSALWGLSIGIIVRVHLLALFVVPFSVGAALPLAGFLPAVAAWLPLPVGARALGFDLSPFGLSDEGGPSSPVVPFVAGIWLASALCIAFWSFLRRDILLGAPSGGPRRT